MTNSTFKDNTMNHVYQRARSQKYIVKNQGAVLVMSLLMLFVLTLIGVSGINTSTLEEKMSGNNRNRLLAFQAAETGIREAELTITNDVANPTGLFTTTQTTDGYYALGQGPSTTDALNADWWNDSNNTRISYAGDLQGDISSAAQYTIEYTGETSQDEATDINIFGGEEQAPAGSIHTFRITVRATGLNSNAVVVIQSYFGKRI